MARVRPWNLDEAKGLLGRGAWLLVLVAQQDEVMARMLGLLEAESLEPCADNFEIFRADANAEALDALGIDADAALHVFVGKLDESYRSMSFEHPLEIEAEDLVQFLDDTASFLELEGME